MKGGMILSVYDNVKRLCEERGVSIAKMERDCDIANGSTGKWKDGPNLMTAKKIAEYFECPIEELLKE